MLVIPATLEAEAKNRLNTGDKDYSEPTLHHCAPAWATRVNLCLKNNNNNSISYSWFKPELPNQYDHLSLVQRAGYFRLYTLLVYHL